MLAFDPERVLVNVRQADTNDLLDRATVYRAGMEPEALDIIEAELRERGVTPRDIDAHANQRDCATYLLPDGTVNPCAFCHRPAITHGWGWHRLWGMLPVFPRYEFYCEVHRPG